MTLPLSQTPADSAKTAANQDIVLTSNWRQELASMIPFLEALFEALLNDDELLRLFVKPGAIREKPLGEKYSADPAKQIFDPTFVESCTLSFVNMTSDELKAALNAATVEAYGDDCSKVTLRTPLLKT